MLASYQGRHANTAASQSWSCEYKINAEWIYWMSIATYISWEQAALSGASILSPSFSIFGRLNGDSPPYGILPPLNISQHVTPNAHYMMCNDYEYIILYTL